MILARLTKTLRLALFIAPAITWCASTAAQAEDRQFIKAWTDYDRDGETIKVTAPGPFMMDGDLPLTTDPDGPTQPSNMRGIATVDMRNGWFNTAVITRAALDASGGPITIITDDNFDTVIFDPREKWERDRQTFFTTPSGAISESETIYRLYDKLGQRTAYHLKIKGNPITHLNPQQPFQTALAQRKHEIREKGYITSLKQDENTPNLYHADGGQLHLTINAAPDTPKLTINLQNHKANLLRLPSPIPDNLIGKEITLLLDLDRDVLQIDPALDMRTMRVDPFDLQPQRLAWVPVDNNGEALLKIILPDGFTNIDSQQTVRVEHPAPYRQALLAGGSGSNEAGYVRMVDGINTARYFREDAQASLFILRHTAGRKDYYINGGKGDAVILHPMTNWHHQGLWIDDAGNNWQRWDAGTKGARRKYLVHPDVTVAHYKDWHWAKFKAPPEGQDAFYPGSKGNQRSSGVIISRGGPVWVGPGQFPLLEMIAMRNDQPNEIVITREFFARTAAGTALKQGQQPPTYHIDADKADIIKTGPDLKLIEPDPKPETATAKNSPDDNKRSIYILEDQAGQRYMLNLPDDIQINPKPPTLLKEQIEGIFD